MEPVRGNEFPEGEHQNEEEEDQQDPCSSPRGWGSSWRWGEVVPSLPARGTSRPPPPAAPPPPLSLSTQTRRMTRSSSFSPLGVAPRPTISKNHRSYPSALSWNCSLDGGAAQQEEELRRLGHHQHQQHLERSRQSLETATSTFTPSAEASFSPFCSSFSLGVAEPPAQEPPSQQAYTQQEYRHHYQQHYHNNVAGGAGSERRPPTREEPTANHKQGGEPPHHEDHYHYDHERFLRSSSLVGRRGGGGSPQQHAPTTTSQEQLPYPHDFTSSHWDNYLLHGNEEVTRQSAPAQAYHQHHHHAALHDHQEQEHYQHKQNQSSFPVLPAQETTTTTSSTATSSSANSTAGGAGGDEAGVLELLERSPSARRPWQEAEDNRESQKEISTTTTTTATRKRTTRRGSRAPSRRQQILARFDELVAHYHPKEGTVLWLEADIRDEDVLFGRGQPRRDHIGNKRFRDDVIKPLVSEYIQATTRVRKCELALRVAEDVVVLHGGRFLKPNNERSGYKKPKNGKEVREKILHAFRDAMD